MKYSFVVLVLGVFFLVKPVYSQINTGKKPGGVGEQRPERRLCFQRSTDRLSQRFLEWECGEDDRIIDCNERLEANEDGTMVIHRRSGAPFTGRCETCHQNGIKQRVVNFVDGRTDGIDTTYYYSGCPQVIRNHIQGVENGKWTYYNDSSGLIAWQINYFNGEKHGKSIYFSHYIVGTDELEVKVGNEKKKIKYGIYDSDTLRIENYNNGKLHGTRKEYYPGSKLEREVNYNMGILDGPFIVYNKEGDVLQELNYDQGIKEGEWKYYYETGELLKIENWRKGVKNGSFKTFFIRGGIQEVEQYDRRGRKDGWFEKRYPNDVIKEKRLYKKDELLEKHVFDKYGNEIETEGEEAEEGDEDDEMPTTKSSRKWWQFWKKK